MGKMIDTVLCAAFALICLWAALFFMPYAELGFNGNFPQWSNWFVKPLGLDKAFESAKDLGDKLTTDLKEYGATARQVDLTDPAKGASYGDYGYALALGLALIAGGIAVAAIGREEAEESTVLPVKK